MFIEIKMFQNVIQTMIWHGDISRLLHNGDAGDITQWASVRMLIEILFFLVKSKLKTIVVPSSFFSLFLFFLLIWSMIYDKACWGSFQDGVIVKQLKPDYIRDYRNYITDYRNVVPFIYGDNLCFFQLS
jgi:hypothetical protein